MESGGYRFEITSDTALKYSVEFMPTTPFAGAALRFLREATSCTGLASGFEWVLGHPSR
jgi:hypothetical protein